MTWLDLHEGILEEFAERASVALRDDALSVRWTNGRRAVIGASTRLTAAPDTKAADQRKYAAIKSDPERLARRREVARLSAEKKRRAEGVGTVRGRPKKAAA